MAVKTVGTNWNRDTRNTIDENDKNLQRQINDLVLSSGDSNAEVVQARGGKPTLNDRLDSIEYEKASRTELSEGLAKKMTRGESISVEQIDKNSGKFDETYMSEEFLQQMAGNTPIHGVPADGGVTTQKLADGAVTSIKRTPLGNEVFLTISENGNFPDFDPTTKTIKFLSNTFIVSGRNRYTIPEGTEIVPETDVPSGGYAVFYGVETGSFTYAHQTHISQLLTHEKYLLIAFVFRHQGKWLLHMNCDYTINGKKRYLSEDDISDYEFNLKNASNFGRLPLITSSVNNDIPTFNTETGVLNLEGSHFLFIGDKRYTLTDIIIDPRSEYPTYTTLCVYFDTALEEIEYRPPTNLTGLSKDSVLLCIINKDNNSKWKITILGDVNYVPNEKAVSEKPYLFANKNIINNYPNLTFPAIGGEGSYFDYFNDSHEKVYSFFDDLMERYPNYISKILLGNATFGEPIYLYRFYPQRASTEGIGNSFKPYPKLLLSASIHGGENLGVTSLCYLMQSICEDYESDDALYYMRHFINFEVVPLKNPGSYDAKEYNFPNDVNINRNFDYLWEGTSDPHKGSAPFSEVETQIIRDWLLDNTDAIHNIDIHVRGGRGTVPDSQIIWASESSTDLVMTATNYIEDLSAKWGSRYSNLKGKGILGYATNRKSAGTFRCWAHHVVGVPSSTWEGFSKSTTLSNTEDSQIVSMNVEMLGQYILDVIRYYNTCQKAKNENV